MMCSNRVSGVFAVYLDRTTRTGNILDPPEPIVHRRNRCEVPFHRSRTAAVAGLQFSAASSEHHHKPAATTVDRFCLCRNE